MHALRRAGLAGVARVLAGLLVPLRCASGNGAMDPLRGEYGFLTKFDSITELEARERVRRMVKVFGIREFQFYDAFEGYSHPPKPVQKTWHCRCLNRPIWRRILHTYIDEIARQGGRSWLYVQVMATDPGDVKMQEGFNVTGHHMVNGEPLLDVVVPNSAWARVIAPRWAIFAASMGFSGIHWDTLGDFNGAGKAGCDLPGFLNAALPVLRQHGLAQTCNFVDGFGWDDSLRTGVGWAGNVIAFPYWEAWTMPLTEDRFFREAAPRGGGVYVCYPGRTAAHDGERQNKLAVGVWPIDLAIQRWQKARCQGSTYLVIGDGLRHIQSEYFPDTLSLSEDDAQKIRDSVFTDFSSQETCAALLSAARPWWDWRWGAPLVVPMLLLALGLGAVSSSYARCRRSTGGQSQEDDDELSNNESQSSIYSPRAGAFLAKLWNMEAS